MLYKEVNVLNICPYYPCNVNYLDYPRISQPSLIVINDIPQNVTVLLQGQYGPGYSRNLASGGQTTFNLPTLPAQGQQRIWISVDFLVRGWGRPTTCSKLIDYNNQTNQTHTVRDVITAGVTGGTCM